MKTRIVLLVVIAVVVMIAGCKKEEEKTLAAKLVGNYFVKDTSLVDLSNSICVGNTDIFSAYAITIAEKGENSVAVIGMNGCSDDTIVGTVTETSFVTNESTCYAYNISATISGSQIVFTYGRVSPCYNGGKAVATKQQ